MKAETAPHIKNLVNSALEKSISEKLAEDEHHLKVIQNVKEKVEQLLPSLAELKDALPSENLKVVTQTPELDFERRHNPFAVTEVNLIDVIFFGRLVKQPVKIATIKNRADEFLSFSRTKQSPQLHPSEYWRKDWCVFDDDGRWLSIRGRIDCVWGKPKDARDGYYLCGHSLSITVSRITADELGHDVEAATYRTTDEATASFVSVIDFLKVLTIVCAENAKLCPQIDRYFTFRQGRTSRYANLSGTYVSQEPIVESMKPYLVKSPG